MIRYLTVEQVLFIHARLIEETGGSHGLRELGLLESAVMRPRATFGGRDLYPDLFSKAAALFHSLIHNHAFVDGNKRTAIVATGLFLLQNQYRLVADQNELESFTLSVVTTSVEVETIRAWLKEHSNLI
jgi:death-on-curing protein